jgi:metal-responsive CopG/Arc/MetJ family transcriptional regulator
MAKSIAVEPKKRGRPATGRDPVIGLRLSPEKTEQLDAWAAAKGLTSRSEAVRLMIDQALSASKKKGR